MDINQYIDFEKLKNTVVDNLTAQWAELIAMLPNLIGAFVILLFGLGIAYIFKQISTSLLRKVGLDRISNKAGVSNVMEDAGLARRPSKLAGKVVFWLVFFVFMVPAANALGMDELVKLFKSFISFLPKIITAMVIVIFGMMFAQFLRKTIVEKPSAIGSNSAKTLGNLVYGIMVTVIVLIALEQLNIQTELLHNIIMLVVAGIMLALVFSVGLGTREVSNNLLSGIYAREHFKPGEEISVGDTKGTVQEVSTLSTLILVSENTSVSVPNSELYKHVVTITAAESE